MDPEKQKPPRKHRWKRANCCSYIVLCLLTVSGIVAGPLRTKRSNWKCYGCELGLGVVLPRLKRENLTDSETVKLLQKGCSILNIQSKEVCIGAINNMKDQIVTVARELDLSAKQVCSIIPDPGFQGVCWPELSPWDSETWSTKIPDKNLKYVPQAKTTRANTKMKILHLSDIHIDPDYEADMPAACQQPLCCRKDSIPHGKFKAYKNKPSNYWYTHDVAHCDIPERFVRAAFEHIANTHTDLALIYWTGDLPPHNVWEQDLMSEHKRLIALLADMLHQYFPNIPVHYTIGNHESHPVNSFPIHNKSAPLYTKMADSFQKISNLPQDQLENFRIKGFYSAVVRPGFRVISLNTNLCNNQNFWLLLDVEDPDHSLAFLVNELLAAENAKEKVHIIGHIAPGITPDCVRQWSLNYNRVVRRFQDTISAQFFGHWHFDMFEIVTNDDLQQHPIGVNFMSPSLTTYDGGHPAYRIFETDSDYQINDYWTYISTGTDAELNDKTKPPSWELEYTASELFGGRPTPKRMQDYLKAAFVDFEKFEPFHEIKWKSLMTHYAFDFDFQRNSTRCFDDIRCKRAFLCPYTSQKSFTDCTLFN